MLFSWLNQRALRRRQEKLDAITKIFGLDDPELLANDQRAMERGRLAQLAELRRREREGCDLLGRPQREYSLDEYTELITGNTADVKYRAQSSSGDHSYDFDGFSDGYLVWGIANADSHFGSTALADGGLQKFVAAAREQDAARGPHPIMWCLQNRQDLARLQPALTQARSTSITLRHVPPHL